MDFLLTKEKIYDKIFLENKKGEQKMKYKGHTISDAEIDKMMDKLDLSLEEACDMILADKEMIVDETVEELTKKAHKNRVTTVIHDAKGEKKERKPREKKENPLKKEIINIIFTSLQKKLIEHGDFLSINVTNNEKYIDFAIGNRTFTVNLVEHRGKKK